MPTYKIIVASNSFKSLRAVTLLVVFTFLCVEYSFSTEGNNDSNTINYEGNKIKFGEKKTFPGNYAKWLREQRAMLVITSLPDSIPTIDPNTGARVYKPVDVDIVPVALNDNPILGNEPQYYIFGDQPKYSEPVLKGGEDVEKFLFESLQDVLNKLEDGYYEIEIEGLVIDDKGQVAYYRNATVTPNQNPYEKPITIDEQKQKVIDARLQRLIASSFIFKPAVLDGKPVNVRLPINRMANKYSVQVKGNKAYLVEMGC